MQSLLQRKFRELTEIKKKKEQANKGIKDFIKDKFTKGKQEPNELTDDIEKSEKSKKSKKSNKSNKSNKSKKSSSKGSNKS